MEDLALEDLADALVLQRLEDLALRGWLDPGDGPLLRSLRARRAAGKGKSSGQGAAEGSWRTSSVTKRSPSACAAAT